MLPRPRVACTIPALLLLAAACGPAFARPTCPAADTGCVDTGYGTQLRRHSTSATTSYIAQPNDAAGLSRVEQLIEARMAGVDVSRAGGEFTVRIRGGYAPNNRGEPLIVVDGIPTPVGVTTSTALGAIAPAFVARIDVLKDIGATSVYGARGVNGVILVTTRR